MKELLLGTARLNQKSCFECMYYTYLQTTQCKQSWPYTSVCMGTFSAGSAMLAGIKSIKAQISATISCLK